MRTGNLPDKSRTQYIFNAALTAVGAQVGCITLIIVFSALFIGRWLDQLLGTKPILLIILILSSAPLALVITFKVAMRAVNRIPTPQSSDKQTHSQKEEETSE